MIGILLKGFYGAFFVILISIIAKTKNYYIAGLLPLFPIFTIITHLIVGSDGTPGHMRSVIIFGLWSIIPYALYLATMYILNDRYSLPYTIAGGLIVWLIAALILVYCWNRFVNVS